MPTVINEALLLSRPRHRSTAMCFFPSNIAQRLAIRRPLIGSFFFSSMLFGEELGRPQWGCCAVDMNAPAVMVIFVRSFNCGVFYSVPFSGQLMYYVKELVSYSQILGWIFNSKNSTQNSTHLKSKKQGGGYWRAPEFDIFEHIIAGIQPATGGLRRISVQKAACRRAT